MIYYYICHHTHPTHLVTKILQLIDCLYMFMLYHKFLNITNFCVSLALSSFLKLKTSLLSTLPDYFMQIYTHNRSALCRGTSSLSTVYQPASIFSLSPWSERFLAARSSLRSLLFRNLCFPPSQIHVQEERVLAACSQGIST